MDGESYTQELRAAFERLDLTAAGTLMDQHAHAFPAETDRILMKAVGSTDTEVYLRLMDMLESELVPSNVLSRLCHAAVKCKNWDLVFEAIIYSRGDDALPHVISAGVDHVRMFAEHVWNKAHQFGYMFDHVAWLLASFVDQAVFDLLTEVLVTLSQLNNRDCYINPVGHWNHEITISWEAFCYIANADSYRVNRGWALYSKSTRCAVFKSMSEDKRAPCQYLAAFLAPELDKWDFLCSALRSGKVKLTKLLDYESIFSRAVSKHAWSCAATVFHLVVATPKLRFIKVATFHSILRDAQIIVGEPRTMLLLVRRCARLKLFAAGALLAVMAKPTYWSLVRKMMAYFEQGKHDTAVFDVLNKVMLRHNFRLVSKWMGHRPGQKLQPQYINCIVFEASGHLQCPEARVMLDLLMCQVSDKMHMEAILHNILFYCRTDLLSRLLARDLLHKLEIRNIGLSLAMLMDNIRLPGPAWHTTATSVTELPHYKMLLKFFEAGLFTLEFRKEEDVNYDLLSSVRPVDNAVYRGLMPVIRILYATGVLTHTMVHSLLGEFYKPKHKEVMSFLQDVDSTPRSLTNRCCIVLSNLLGCRGDRKQRALSLGLPLALTRKVLFLDVLYPEDYDDFCEADYDQLAERRVVSGCATRDLCSTFTFRLSDRERYWF